MQASCSVHLKCLQRQLLSVRIAVICQKKWVQLKPGEIILKSKVDDCHTRIRFTKSTLVHFLQTSRCAYGPWPSQAKTVDAANASSTAFIVLVPRMVRPFYAGKFHICHCLSISAPRNLFIEGSAVIHIARRKALSVNRCQKGSKASKGSAITGIICTIVAGLSKGSEMKRARDRDLTLVPTLDQ